MKGREIIKTVYDKLGYNGCRERGGKERCKYERTAYCLRLYSHLVVHGGGSEVEYRLQQTTAGGLGDASSQAGGATLSVGGLAGGACCAGGGSASGGSVGVGRARGACLLAGGGELSLGAGHGDAVGKKG